MIFKRFNFNQQLIISFTAVIIFVIVLGTVSYRHTEMMHKKSNILYHHSLMVKGAIGEFKSNVIAIHRDMKDLFLFPDDEDIAMHLARIESYKTDAYKQLDIIYDGYLGSKAEIDTLRMTFAKWNSMREETIRLMRAGDTEIAAQRTRSDGIAGSQVDVIIGLIENINLWSIQNADMVFIKTAELNSKLNRQIVIFTLIILLIITVIYFVLSDNIKRPLTLLMNAIHKFHEGSLSARCNYETNNEFGRFAAAFNSLANFIEEKIDKENKSSSLAKEMLETDIPEVFFMNIMRNLIEHTGSEMAAVYLRTEDEKTLHHFTSIGLDTNKAHQSFSIEQTEGEFGIALSTGKIHHLTKISENSRFVFKTVSGDILPSEIITIPIIAGNDTLGCISLAGINPYEQEIIQWLEQIHSVLSARVSGILAAMKMKEYLQKVEIQNIELETQKEELEFQSTELAQQNEMLQQQKKKLNEANRLKTTFLSNMSHELRTPLNSIIALSGLLNRKLDKIIPQDEYDHLQVIERNGKRLLDLINDLLDIARIESGRIEVNQSMFNIGDVINEIIQLLEPQIKEKNISVKQKITDDPFIVNSDKDKCYHILQNIISNAVKFTEKGKITIKVFKDAKHFMVSVKDTGIGIPNELIPHIFDEFRQVDSSHARNYEGTGLGLAIVHKYVEMLDGSIEVSSQPGKGSEFIVKLPLNNKPEEENVNVKKNTITSDTSEYTILLVEDSEPAIVQIMDVLEEKGYNIMVARNGKEALQNISEYVPDAIILDLMMPEIDGFEVLKRIRENENTQHLPVLILTAKHITTMELSFLKRNNIHQLILKGDVNRLQLLNAVDQMILKSKENKK